MLEFKNSFGKHCLVFPKNPKHYFCLVLFRSKGFAKIEGLVTFLLYDLEC